MKAVRIINKLWSPITSRLNAAGHWLPPFFLRALLFWEFYVAGLGKLNGENWFGAIHQNFPPVFRSFSSDSLWLMAAWGETIFALLLLFGCLTRFAAFSLIIITTVATYAVHWPESYDSLAQLWQGYAISNDGYGNFKLPLIYIVMLLPLVFSGGGKLSMDYFFTYLNGTGEGPAQQSDLISKGLALLAFSAPIVFFFPVVGIISGCLAVLLIVASGFITPQD